MTVSEVKFYIYFESDDTFEYLMVKDGIVVESLYFCEGGQPEFEILNQTELLPSQVFADNQADDDFTPHQFQEISIGEYSSVKANILTIKDCQEKIADELKSRVGKFMHDKVKFLKQNNKTFSEWD